MKRIFAVFCLLVCIFRPSALYAADFLGVFDGASLDLDTQIESPAINNRVLTLPPQRPGDVIRMQLFVPAAAGRRTLGYNVEFHLVGKAYFDYLSAPAGRTWDGAELLQIAGRPVVSALLISTPTIPGNGYLGTVEIRVVRPLEQGTILAVRSAAMADPSTDNDPLNVSSAAISFTSTVKPIPGDLNLDGAVDFADFLLFASNYGKSGPVPTALPTEPQIVYIRDTVVVRDTVRVVVRDTVYLSSAPPPSQPSAPVRGSNKNAVSSLDLAGIGGGVVGNGIDDKVVQGTVSGRGTRIVVEVFAAGVTTALSGASAVFDIDTRLVRIVSVTAPSIFPLVLPHYDATATVGAFAPGLPPNGLVMTVTFETVSDVTSVPFSIGLQSLDIAVSPTDRDILTAGRVSFNTSQSDINSPATPGAFAAVLRSATTIELRWSAPTRDHNGGPLTGLSGFVIYRAVGTANAGFIELARVDSTRRTLENSGLAFNTTYIYQVSAIDAQGNESPRSSSVTLTTATAGAAVASPTNLTATYVGNVILPRVELSWTPPVVFDSFLIQRATVVAGSSTLTFSTLQQAHMGTTYNDTDIQSGTTYAYRVSTNRTGQTSDPSNTAAIQIP